MNKHFDKQLLLHIRNRSNDEAKAMLTVEMAQAVDESDSYMTLLHFAVEHNNAEIARRLIELGADVDRFGVYNTTPLVIAVMHKYATAVQVLLKYGARLDIVDNDGFSALQWGLDTTYANSEIVELLVRKLRTVARTNEELAEILIRAGCNMCHAAMLRDVNLLRCMLKRGVDVNSKGGLGVTALHVTSQVGGVNLANWLLKKGADVDVLDDMEYSALRNSVWWGNKDVMQVLLEHGAFADVKGHYNEFTALYTAFSRLDKGPDVLVDCAEILLQYGASLPKSKYLLKMFSVDLSNSCDKAVKLLIAHLAMLEKLGKPVEKSVMDSVDDSHRTKMSELQKYYEPCQQILSIKVFEKLSLLNLLNDSNRKMKLLVRKKTFLQKMEKICSENKLSELYPYYYNSMMRRIEKAKRVVKLEDEAVLVICKIFKANCNQFYHFASGVVEYLNERDLERLVQV